MQFVPPTPPAPGLRSKLRQRALGVLAIALPGSLAAQPAVVQTDQVRAELVVHAPQGLVAGQPAWLGLRLRHAAHWHSYWKNPGDSGMATRLSWALPNGVSAGEIEWPTPKRLPVGPLINYGYEGDVLLPVALSVPADFRAATLDVKLHAQWLVCKDQCIPQSGDFVLSIAAGAAVPAHVAHAAAFANARAALPRPSSGVSAQARVEDASLVFEASGLPAQWPGRAIDFFAEDGGVIEHAAAVEQRWEGGRLWLRVPLSAQRSEGPDPMRAVLAARGDSAGQAVQFAVQGGWPAVGAAPAQPSVAAPGPVPTAAQRAPSEGRAGWSSVALVFAGLVVAVVAGRVWRRRRHVASAHPGR
jgi:DsbC/DsbD-like thiol-disulfide interchange protein